MPKNYEILIPQKNPKLRKQRGDGSPTLQSLVHKISLSVQSTTSLAMCICGRLPSRHGYHMKTFSKHCVHFNRRKEAVS